MSLISRIKKGLSDFEDVIIDLRDESYKGISEYSFWRLHSMIKNSGFKSAGMDGNSPSEKIALSLGTFQINKKYYTVTIYPKHIEIFLGHKSRYIDTDTNNIIQLSYDEIDKDPAELVLRYGLGFKTFLNYNCQSV